MLLYKNECSSGWFMSETASAFALLGFEGIAVFQGLQRSRSKFVCGRGNLKAYAMVLGHPAPKLLRS